MISLNPQKEEDGLTPSSEKKNMRIYKYNRSI